MLPSQFFMLICFCQFLNYNTPSSHSRSPAATRFTSPWSFPFGIHTKHHRTFLHNSRELEIALGLISGMVDRNVAFMTELYNVVVHRRITRWLQ